jgi:hypothetical protein
VANFIYLEMTVNNENCIHEKTKSRLNSGNACYDSDQNLLSSGLLSKILKIKIQKAIILPIALYGCGTWSLTLREEHKLKVFENRVLRIISGPKREEVTGGWRKFNNEELKNLSASPYIIRIIKSRRMRWAGHAARTGKMRNAYINTVGKLERNRPLVNTGVVGNITLEWIVGK